MSEGRRLRGGPTPSHRIRSTGGLTKGSPSRGVALLLAPTAALGTVLGLDRVLAWHHWPLVVVGLLDEPAHLLTAALLLSGVAGCGFRRWRLWILAGSVGIDVDHVPLYTFAHQFSVGGRPPTHALITVLALVVLAQAVGPLRTAAAGLAAGVALHLVRDLATGPGVPLFWPASDVAVRVPYLGYVVVLGLAALGATYRIWRGFEKPHAASVQDRCL